MNQTIVSKNSALDYGKGLTFKNRFNRQIQCFFADDRKLLEMPLYGFVVIHKLHLIILSNKGKDGQT